MSPDSVITAAMSFLNLGETWDKKRKLDEMTHADAAATENSNPFLRTPVPHPDRAVLTFLYKAHQLAWKSLPAEQKNGVMKKPQIEVEGRLGILTILGRRVTSSGAKLIDGQIQHVFLANQGNQTMLSGINKSHFVRWTTNSSTSGGSSSGGGPPPLSSPVHQALNDPKLSEKEYTETVYSYKDGNRLAFRNDDKIGRLEAKQKLDTLDLIVASAPYDVRLTINLEKNIGSQVDQIHPNWISRRVKRRRSFSRRDGKIPWQIDATEVTTTFPPEMNKQPEVSYELELELNERYLLYFLNERDDAKVREICKQLASQFWWMISVLNPLKDTLDVEDIMQEHPDKDAVILAQAQCLALKLFVDRGNSGGLVIGNPNASATAILQKTRNIFPGCMPVNFSRHHIEEIQRSEENAYFLSEKTDGVRYLLVFTGKTVVLLDRKMRGKQPKSSIEEPFTDILHLVKPGTVLDGEVVMNRRFSRPVFIVFDVMASSGVPTLHLPFEQRLRHLKEASFSAGSSSNDLFDGNNVKNPNIPLPFLRKNFVKRLQLDSLLSNVVEEKGSRTYKSGDLHNHLTDGIIFQPNLPYVCGTDLNLLKWKYLDTVTIDLEMTRRYEKSGDEILSFACLGEDNTRIDMTRYVDLPQSDMLRLEADQHESKGRIVEVGFDSETGEWYYVTIRSDKEIPNHINTVLGSLFELSESLSTEELRYRMSIPPGMRDNFRKEFKSMIKQLLDHQRKRTTPAREL